MNKQLILSKTFKCSCCKNLVPKYKFIYNGYKPIDQRAYIWENKVSKIVCQRCFNRLKIKQKKKRNNIAENMVGLKYGL